MATTPLDPTQSAHGAPTAPPAAPAAPAATGTVRDRLADLATRFQRVDLSVEVHLNDPAIGDGAELAIRTRIESLFDETRAALGISGFTDVSFDSRVHPAVEIGVAVEIAVVIEPAIEPIGPDGAWEHDRAASSLVYDIAPGKGASGGFGRPAPSGDELFAKIRVIVSDVLLDRELVLDGALPSDTVSGVEVAVRDRLADLATAVSALAAQPASPEAPAPAVATGSAARTPFYGAGQDFRTGSGNILPADLRGSNLSGAILYGVDLTHSNLSGANLWGADLRGATLYRADLTGATLSWAKLTNANLSGVNLNLAILTQADLRGADLSRANLNGANLTGANLTGANFTNAYLNDANLSGADLTGADLTDANLSRANLTRASLIGANLSRANLEGANFTDADLTGAYLSGAWCLDSSGQTVPFTRSSIGSTVEETPSAVLVVRTPDGDRTFDFDLRNQIGSYQSRSDTTVRPSLALWVTLPSVHGVSEVGQRRIDERVGQAVGTIARIAGLPEADVQVSFAPATDSVHQAYGISATFSERTGPGGPGLPVPGQACDTPVFGIDIFGTDTYGNAPAAGRHEDPLLVDIRDAIRAAHERAVIRQDKPSRSERQLASTGRHGAGWHLADGTIIGQPDDLQLVIGQSDDLQLVIEINPGGRKACTRVYKAVEAGIRGWALATLGISDLPIHVIPADPEGTVPRGGFVTTWSIRVRGTEVDPTGLRPFAERITVTPPEGSTLVVVNAILDAFLAVTADYAGPSSRHIREDAEARLHKAFAEWGPANEAYRLALRDVEADCTSCEALRDRDAFLLRCIDREARVRTAFDVFRDYAPARFGVVHQWVDGILSELDAASYVY